MLLHPLPALTVMVGYIPHRHHMICFRSKSWDLQLVLPCTPTPTHPTDGDSEKHYLRHLESYGSNSVLIQITSKSYPRKILYPPCSCAREDVKLDQVWANDWGLETIICDKTRKTSFVQPRKGQGDLWSHSIRWIRERNYGKAVSVWIKSCDNEK